jgi:hypothetical protein
LEYGATRDVPLCQTGEGQGNRLYRKDASRENLSAQRNSVFHRMYPVVEIITHRLLLPSDKRLLRSLGVDPVIPWSWIVIMGRVYTWMTSHCFH